MTWQWCEPQRAFTGHLLASRDGKRLFTGEMNLETGAGLIGVRDAVSLEKMAEWPSFGRDPHQMVWDATRPDALLVANGGIETRPETGRIKHNLAQRLAAPVLAIFDGQQLRVIEHQLPLAGYGGDIAAMGQGFAVGCPKANGVALFSPDLQHSAFLAWPEACALTAHEGELWAAGGSGALVLSKMTAMLATPKTIASMRIDNHWLAL